MRFAFFTAILFAGYFVVFQMTPLTSEAILAASGQENNPTCTVEAPIEPQINRNTVGGKLFMENCARCHNANLQKESTGPALWGVGERVDRKLLAEWIRNSPKVLESGNVYFNKLMDKYNGAAMDPMTHLKPDEIEAIIDEITSTSR